MLKELFWNCVKATGSFLLFLIGLIVLVCFIALGGFLFKAVGYVIFAIVGIGIFIGVLDTI